ncbi:MAG TPA: ABC transporter permease, partial [Thermoanaerobaculia bacterium]|nr:ABC transporter permease [Thermoanaerobaculia bacterium]
MFLENLKIALRAIFANKMRSILTVLGVMIGVAAVIAVVSLVQGMQYKLAKDLQDIGSTFIEVYPEAGEQKNPLLQKLPDLTNDDAVAVQRGASAIKEFTPIFLTTADTKHGDARHSAPLRAVNGSYEDVAKHYVDTGRFFTPIDEDARKAVCVIGLKIVERLNLGPNPIGQVIIISGSPFTVIGVMEKKGSSFGREQDDVVFIPFNTATTMFGAEEMKKLVLAFQARSATDVDLAKEQVTEILRSRHHLKKGERDDFRILAQEELLKTISTILGYTTAIMAAVVGIALLVGGIGIMNIMLVSVTERTREIGIRKSIGARRQDVLLQFLIEAISLSGLGGLVGIAIGYVMAAAVRTGLSKFVDLPPVHTPIWAIGVAFT